MKSRSEIWLCALDELGAQCSVSTQRDAVTLARRVSREGDAFLQAALPKYAKDLERSLAMQRIPRDAFAGFQRGKVFVDVYNDVPDMMHLWTSKYGGGTPKFLGGFMDLVFNAHLHASSPAVLEYMEENRDLHLVPRIRVYHDLDLVARQADAIAAIRQLCLMFSKEKEQCAPIHVEAAVKQFAETDSELDVPLGASREMNTWEKLPGFSSWPVSGGQSS